MSFRGVVKIDGAEELIKRFRGLQLGQMETVLKKALKQASKPVENAVRRNAPRGTGALAENVRVGKVTRGKTDVNGHRALSVVVYAGRASSTNQEFIGDFYYLGFVEYGTKPRYHKSGKFVGQVHPNNFMQRAFNETKSEVAAIMEGVITRELDRLLGASDGSKWWME